MKHLTYRIWFVTGHVAIVIYEPRWWARLFGRRPYTRVAECHIGTWYWSVTQLSVPYRVEQEIERAFDAYAKRVFQPFRDELERAMALDDTNAN